MRNENGESRGFGFVSYQTPDQGKNQNSSLFSHIDPSLIATAAMHGMNGVQLGSKQIVVRLHEPKQLRQEKLAHRFGQSHPRSSSGATSPTASEAGDGWPSPRHLPSILGSSMGSHYERPDRGRRGSGSYYNVKDPKFIWQNYADDQYRLPSLARLTYLCAMTTWLPSLPLYERKF